MKSVVIYTDGACKGNPGPGGWGALLKYPNGNAIKELYDGENDTTNNRMELTAAIMALEALRETCNVQLFTDSKYVQNGIQTWMKDWLKRDWKTAAKKPVKNKDLWQELDKLSQKHHIVWHWVKGHSGDPGNERADQLANMGIEKLEIS